MRSLFRFWPGIVCVLVVAAILALGTAFALADEGDGGGSPESGESGASEEPADDPSDDPYVDPHPDRQEGDIYDGEIIDYNTDNLVLTIAMGADSLTLEVGESVSIPCVVTPHEGILHTEENGDILFYTSAHEVCSDASVVRAVYDLDSDTLSLWAYEPGTVTVTVNASLIYATPVSASVTVTVPEPEQVDDDEYAPGTPGGKGDGNTNVINGSGESGTGYLSTGGAGGYNAPAAAADSSVHPTVTMPEMQAAPEVSVVLYELEEVDPTIGADMAQGLSTGFWVGVWLVALAIVVFGGGETYTLFRRRLA